MKIVLSILFLLLPLVWSKYVIANYLSTKTILFYFVSSLSLLALPSRLKIRNIPKPLLVLLPIIVIYYLVHTFIDLKYVEILTVFKMLGFCFISIYIYSLCTHATELTQRLSPYLVAMWATVLGIGMWQAYHYFFQKGVVGVYKILGSFGNVNMFAEFLVLTLPFLYFWLNQKKDLVPYFIKYLIFIVSIFLIVYLNSRSAWLGAALWILIFGIQYFKKIEWIGVVLSILLAIAAYNSVDTANRLAEEKSISVGIRSSLYSASLNLMLDNPFGIRPGQFMNDVVPYMIQEKVGPHEFSYFDQPHSEFLKWGVQQGIPFLALTLAVFCVLAFVLLRDYIKSNKQPESETLLYLGSFIAASPQITFQFPFENPASAMVLAILFGLWLSKFSESGRHIDLRWMFPAIGAVSIVGIINAGLFTFSIILESIFPTSPDLMNVVCKAYPANFRACHLKNRNLFDLKNIPAFRQEFKTDYANNPFFCDNLRLLPEYFNYSNSEKKTCESIILYSEIFKDQKTFNLQAMPACQKYSNPVPFQNPAQFNQDFRQWFAQNR